MAKYILIKTDLPRFSAGIPFGKGETYVLWDSLSEKQVAALRDDFQKDFFEVDDAPVGAKVIGAPAPEKAAKKVK